MENVEKTSQNKADIKIPAEILEPSMSPEEFNITAETYQFLSDLFEVHGYKKYENVTDGYHALGQDSFIVRREDPRKVMALFSDGEYEIGFEDARYSNCAEWKPQLHGARGIMNAYLEGMTNLNKVVTVVGFYKNENFDLVKLDDAQANFYGLERELVRSIKGIVTEEDVAFISLRIPGHLMDATELTDDEQDAVDEYFDAKERGKESRPVMIHRTYIKKRSVN